MDMGKKTIKTKHASVKEKRWNNGQAESTHSPNNAALGQRCSHFCEPQEVNCPFA